MRSFLLLPLLMLTLTVWALDIEPFDSAEITTAQFNEYHTSVAQELASTHRAYPGHFLEVYSDEGTRASIAFTLPGHPAHPAWVTRQIAMEDGGIYMNVIGYFAGDEKEFVKFFKQYEDMAKETTRGFGQ